MQVALSAGGYSVLFESDSHEVVELVNNRTNSMSEISTHLDHVMA